VISLGTLAPHMDQFALLQKGYRRTAGIATDVLDVYSETKLCCIFIDVVSEHYKISYNPFAFSKA
jgi:hypothetical protein